MPRARSVVAAHPFRDRFSKWPVVLALYDGRACPDCGAVVIHWQWRNTHKELHARQAEFERALHILNDSVRNIARFLEMDVRSATPDDEPGGDDDGYGDDDDDDPYDDRLTRKARLAAQGTVYLDEVSSDEE